MVTWIIKIFFFQVFINFARTQTDETDYDDQLASSVKTVSRRSVRRRAQRLRDMWSVDVQFSPLEEEDGDTVIGDSEDWQVTFADQVSIKWTFLSPGLRSWVGAQPLWKDLLGSGVSSARRTGVVSIQPKTLEQAQTICKFPKNPKFVNFWNANRSTESSGNSGKKSNETQFPGMKFSNIWVYLARLFSEIWKFSKCKPEILFKWKTLLDYCFCLIVDCNKDEFLTL